MILFAATGCPNNSPPATFVKEAKPFAGTSLRIASTDAEVLKAFASRAQGWATRNEAAIKISNLDDADIVIVPPALAGAYAENDDAREVPEELQASDHPGQWVGILRHYRDKLADWNGKPRAIPLAGEGAVLVIRTDRLGDAALKEKYLAKFGRPLPMQPGTWEDLAEIAEACQGLPFAALPARSMQDQRTLADFFRVAACFNQPVLTQSDKSRSQNGATIADISFTHVANTGEPRLTAPGFAAAANWLKRTMAGRLSANDDPVAALASGKAALAVLSLAELGRLPKDDRGMVPAIYAIVPLPGTRTAFDHATGKPITFNSQPNYVPYFDGGWFGVVRKKCSNPAAAFDLLADLCSPARSLEMLSDPALGFGPIRQEQLEQSREAVWQRYGFDAARTRNLADALRSNAGLAAVNPALGLRGPDAAELTAILAKHLNDPPKAQAEWLDHDAKNPNAKLWHRHAAGQP